MASGEGRVEAGLIRELCSADVFVFVGRLKVIMKIAQVAPLIESVPPRLYGGTERIVSYLTEELVRLGHDVTLFASGDSVTTAELAPCCTRALRLDATVRDSVPHFMLMIDKVRERAKEFDVFHFHIDFFHFPLFRSLAARTLTTLHGRQDLADLKPFYSRFGEMPLVSVSNDQRKFICTPFNNTVLLKRPPQRADRERPSRKARTDSESAGRNQRLSGLRVLLTNDEGARRAIVPRRVQLVDRVLAEGVVDFERLQEHVRALASHALETAQLAVCIELEQMHALLVQVAQRSWREALGGPVPFVICGAHQPRYREAACRSFWAASPPTRRLRR